MSSHSPSATSASPTPVTTPPRVASSGWICMAASERTDGARLRQHDVMSENLRLLGEYSEAMEAGDEEAGFSFFAPEVLSHVTARGGTALLRGDLSRLAPPWWDGG